MRIEYDNGYYIGAVNNNEERHGFGKYVWDDGTYYDGEWRNGDMHGHCNRRTYDDGSYYTGAIAYDERHGHGKMTWRDGSYYEGDWRNGDMHGYGKFVFPNGNYYVGNFSADQFCGKGTWFEDHGSLSYEGNWIDDENATDVTKTDHGKKSHGKMVNNSFEADPLNGYAREDYDNGYYEGNFSYGKRHGGGVYYWNDGEKYDGEWHYGDKHGKGIMYYNDGSVYDGKWDHDEWDGHGHLKLPNGHSYHGYFRKGKYFGHGIYTDDKGYCFESGNWTSCGNADPVNLFGNGMMPEKGKLIEWDFISQKRGTERFTQTYRTKDGGEIQVTYAKRYLDNGNTELMIDKIYSTGQTFHQTNHESGMTNIEVGFEGKTFHVLLNSDGTLNKYSEE